MPKSAKDQANQTYGETQQYGQGMNAKGNAAWNAMYPQEVQNATAPKGFSDQDMAKMKTSNSQGAGGATSALTGEANLMAGRTRNPGSMGAGLAEAARTTGRAENANNLKLDEANASLAQQKQQAALGELGKLYGTNVSGLNEMMGNQNKAVSEVQTADQTGFQNAMQIWDEANKSGSAVATAM